MCCLSLWYCLTRNVQYIALFVAWPMTSPMLPHPPAVLDARATQALLTRVDVLGEMRALFTALGRGRAVQPPQAVTLFPDRRGDSITYTGVLPDAAVFGVKVSPYLTGPEGGRVTAWTLLMSLSTGAPLLLCDALELTTARTAATTALAVDLLARSDATNLAIVGSGVQALAHLRYVLPLRAWQSVRLYSPRIAAKEHRLRPVLDELNPDVVMTTDRTVALADAHVVLLCTSSSAPVVEPAELADSVLITSISTNGPQAHEAPPSALRELDVYCDYRATTPSAAAEMCLAHEHGWSPTDVRGDLGELLTGGAAPPSLKRRVFFRSIGLGVEDIQLALAIYHQHSRGTGQ